ncbi:S-layer homology domain-containing protein [Paenibacillus sp. IB182496]|uniref:S-layer homology domain-containing protein n=1 Tax=Paenibacillus sabuli TaxID=2772509 RepID=A0A927GRL4_9BACL|nr:S-layer homology domain-containing protein [Paenibacillus sabuli]MBD2844802.1 S-layer homology domain-containing protein [Paenibacillus sabuli]
MLITLSPSGSMQSLRKNMDFVEVNFFMKKVLSSLLVFALMLPGFMPQAAGTVAAAETLIEPNGEAATIQNYPMPSIYTPSSVYTLKAGNESVPVIQYKPEYDYAQFSFDGTVTIEITANEPITSYSISPLAKNIQGTVDGNKLTFTLSSSTYVIVDINEDPNEKVDESDPAKIRKRLVIAADPLETNIPDPTADDVYDVTGAPYNADYTGATITSDAIQAAIDDAHDAGGGIVYIPAGVYTSSNLTLKSNVDFYLAGGAVIVGTGRGEDYRNDFRKDSLSRDGTYFIRTEVDSENIIMRGRGTIDGKGVEMRSRKMTDAPPTHNQGEGFVNNLLVPIATSNFTFDGLTLRDGGFWAFLVVRSDNVTITNYKGYQDLRMLEDDAIDINESQNVLVKHAIAISDDDTYSTKTWPQKGMSKDWPGAIEHLEDVVFDDALAWSRCAAFKLGMGIATPQIDITIQNSYVYQSARALLVDHAYTSNPLPEEGYAQNVTFENIDIERVGINQFGNYWFRVSTVTSGDVKNILFKNINVRQTGGTSQIQGNPTRGGWVDGLTFTDVYVKGELAKSLSDLKASVRNENVRGVAFVNTTPPIFSDDFEDGTLDKWVLRPEDQWAVTNDGENVLSSGNRTNTSLLIAKEGAAWTDYNVEARTHPHLANGKENAGLLFRVTDEDNYYMYRINAKDNRLELFKAVDGTLTRIEDADTAFTPSKQWYTIKVAVHGNTIEAYVDGNLMTSWTNPIEELTTGGIGFRTTSANVKYDDVLVTKINLAPTDLMLSNDLVVENTAEGSFVGTFSTADPDEQDTFTYTLVAGEGDTDNGSFSIPVLGNSLILRTALDYETKDSYSIRVRSTDSGGLSYEKSFTIHIIEAEELPVESDPDNVLYSDDFADGISADWTSSSGSWRVETEEDSNILVQKADASAVLLHTSGEAWTDYSYEADVRVHIKNANAGLLFRVQDDQNFYMYRLNANNNKLELYQSVDGAMTLLSSSAISAASKQWYTLKVLVYENSIKGYLDGELQLEWTNPVNEWATGSIGLRTTSVNTAYRNILVTGIKQAQSEVPTADPSKNTVTLDRSSVTTGDTVTITAAGDRQNESGTVLNEERYYPVEWSSNELGQSGDFTVTEQVYASSLTASAEGQYLIDVTFQKQIWDGSAWLDVTTDTKTAELTVTAEDDNGGETPSPATADASKNTVNLDRSSVTAGDTVTITAAGDRQNESGTVQGEERYYPVGWSSSEAGKSGTFTVTEQVYASSYTPSAEGQYLIEATFQKQSWDGAAWLDVATDTKTAVLTVTAEDDNSGETPSPPPTGNTGSGHSVTGLSTEATTMENGNRVTTVTIDPARLEQRISREGDGATITIPVLAQSDKIVVELSGQLMKLLKAKDTRLQIKTDKATYTLAAAQINMDAVSQQMGTALEDIKLHITIATPAADTVNQVQDTAQRQGYEVVAQPVEFKIIASSDSGEVEISNFDGYVQRSIALPEEFQSGTTATGVVLGADGSFSHVPTKVVIVDGKPYAQIESLTNSIYLVISNPKTFADVHAHWAMEEINDLGSRLVIDGSGAGNFEPARDITRAEFAAIIIRGLGVMRPGTGKDIFSDVTKDNWYYDAVAIAHEYGIIDGFEDGTFRPANKITREQAMTMTARAMKVTGLKVALAEHEAEQLLSMFADAGEASGYAAQSIASSVKAGIIQGRDVHVLAPKDNMTRAEVAVIVTRLLQQSNLI